jgi:tetratricopeptide (TPR) repeat protein
METRLGAAVLATLQLAPVGHALSIHLKDKTIRLIVSAQQHLNQGIQLGQVGQYAQAVAALEQALSLDPEHVEVLYHLGLAHLHLQQLAPALHRLEQALALAPASAPVHSERGVVLFHLGRQAEALAALDQALALEPQNPYRYASRAYLREATGDTQGAVADYQKALELDPDDAVAHNNLGLLEEKLGRQQTAQQRFIRADELAQRLGYQWQNPPKTEAPAPEKPDPVPVTPSPRLSWATYWGTLRQVAGSAQARREFWAFLRGKKPA